MQPVAEARTVAAAVRDAARRLAAVADNPAGEATFLLAEAGGLTRAGIIANPDRRLDPEVAARFEAAVKRRAAGEPAAYITGHREFFSLPLAITSDVLVPRPETELLVELAIGLAGDGPCRIVDLGTGSGAIALALAKSLPRARVTAIDVSPAACDIAARNASALGLDVRVVCSNWFDALGEEVFDIVVSNPPYVRSDDPHFAGALGHEPRLALDGGADGLDCYRRILDATRAHLDGAGRVILEHGYDQRDALAALAAELGYRVLGAHDDLAGLPRAIVLERVAA